MWPRFSRSNAAKLRASRRNSCTVDIPLMFSCSDALICAIQPRTARYDARALRRNHCVTSAMSGSTENATSASRQSIHSSTPMMPTSSTMSRNTEMTPDANRSFSASTSVVTRVIRRPTGWRS